MLKCKGCGADIPFVPESQNYICPYCDTVHTHEELTEAEKAGEIRAEERVYQADPGAADKMMNVYIYTCPQCGGELMTTEETYATFCSYCGTSVLLHKREGKEEKPRYIIPFKVSKEQAAAIYNDRMKRAWFAPNYIRHMDIEKVRGIYMPYWTYETTIGGHVHGKRVDRIKQAGGTLINTYQVESQLNAMGNGIEYDAAGSFPDDLSQAAGPFHFKNAQNFSAAYMSGFYADRGNMPAESYQKDAHEDMMDIVKDRAQNRLKVKPGDQNYTINSTVTAEKAMYPVWFISARSRLKNKVSYAVINGETGKMAADIPTDPLKLLIGTLGVGLPLFLLFYLLVVPTPLITAIFTAVMAVIGVLIMAFTTVGTEIHAGVNILMNVLAAVICIGLALINPFRDEIYFGGIILAGILCALSYVGVFAKSNKKMLRKLPQLGARGGDENA